MKRPLLLFIFYCFSCVLALNAQETDSVKYIKRLPQAVVIGEKDIDNDTAAYRYRQYQHYVKKVWPYVQEGSALLREIDTQLRSGMSNREKRKYISSVEDEVKVKFEDRLRSLNKTEGAILVKLMNRQIGSPRTIYSILKLLKGSIAAQKYLTIGKMNGMDLSEVYDPLMEPKLEGILRSIGVVGGEAEYFNQQ